MPELPEVEIVRQSLNRHVKNRKIINIQVQQTTHMTKNILTNMTYTIIWVHTKILTAAFQIIIL